MKDLTIDGKLQRVFVLAESDERIVYIPVKALNETDYERLVDLEKKNPRDLLGEMGKTTLSNGRNALSVYDSIIQVMEKKTEKAGQRIPKPEEIKEPPAVVVVQEAPKTTEAPQPATPDQTQVRKAGRPATKA
jgi:hypothetical protein